MSKPPVHKKTLTTGYIVGDVDILCWTTGAGYVERARMAWRWKDVTCLRCLSLRGSRVVTGPVVMYPALANAIGGPGAGAPANSPGLI
jgi:hypothetical protein